MEEIELVGYEPIPQANMVSVFECCNCGLISESPYITGCSKCRGTTWITKFKEVNY